MTNEVFFLLFYYQKKVNCDDTKWYSSAEFKQNGA